MGKNEQEPGLHLIGEDLKIDTTAWMASLIIKELEDSLAKHDAFEEFYTNQWNSPSGPETEQALETAA